MINYLFRELIQDKITMDALIIFILFWIKFNDLAHITKWQKKHTKRSEKLGEDIIEQGNRISTLEGKSDA